jgi:hypothetical protein
VPEVPGSLVTGSEVTGSEVTGSEVAGSLVAGLDVPGPAVVSGPLVGGPDVAPELPVGSPAALVSVWPTLDELEPACVASPLVSLLPPPGAQAITNADRRNLIWLMLRMPES